jgi:hypothetical protein
VRENARYFEAPPHPATVAVPPVRFRFRFRFRPRASGAATSEQKPSPRPWQAVQSSGDGERSPGTRSGKVQCTQYEESWSMGVHPTSTAPAQLDEPTAVLLGGRESRSYDVPCVTVIWQPGGVCGCDAGRAGPGVSRCRLIGVSACVISGPFSPPTPITLAPALSGSARRRCRGDQSVRSAHCTGVNA